MNGDPKLYSILTNLNIPYQYFEHPPAPTIEIALNYWKNIEAIHCKNLFFRNHKGNQHYLTVLQLGLINDHHHHVIVFFDEKLMNAQKISFHPNINTASLTITCDDLLRFIKFCGNDFEFTNFEKLVR